MLLVQEKECSERSKCNKRVDRRISAILSKTSARDFVFSNKNAKNKGQLIYSTCTFAPEENEEIISWLVENYPVTIEEIPLTQSVSSGRSEWEA